MADAFADKASALLGREVVETLSLAGGDLSDVRQILCADGARFVAKTGPLVAAEAAMLRAIRASGARAPEVVGAGAEMLVLEHLGPGAAPDAPAWRDLAVTLRALHGTIGAQYGWGQDYAFGLLEVSNTALPDWPVFWAERRLRAPAAGIAPDLSTRIDTLAARLPELLPAAPPPALLHGDLWGGNIVWAPGRVAGLIDPACYHGDAEVDLAMLTLFDRPPPAFWEAYGPLPPGWEMRRAIYLLWPALVHLRLFGGGYRGMVSGLLDRLAV